jgi:hypothetical protein
MSRKHRSKLLEAQHVFVAYLDVLGQRDELRQLTGLPTDSAKLHEFQATLKKTLGVVLNLRTLFKEYFEQYLRPSKILRALPRAQQAEIRALRRSKISFYGFSDSFVVAVPLRTKNEHASEMNSVFGAIVASCFIPICALASGHALRGGIDVGVSVPLPGGEIYGAGLERAYTLESRVAGYPRIVVGDELLEYLSFVSKQIAATPAGTGARETAQRCLSFFTKDTDEQYILDFLGDAFRAFAAERLPREILVRAYDFVARQQSAFLGDEKLKARYEQLHAYLELRRTVWGL